MDNFQSKADLFLIRLNFDETGTIVQMPLELHNSIEALAQEEDNKLGLNLHCYSNDDYIFLRYMIHHAYTTYKKMSIDPTTFNWIDGCCDIPQIVVRMIEKPALATDENNELILDDNGMYVPDDRKLNAGIGGPYFYENKPYYVFQFNRYMLQRFAIFLQEVFDKNEELVISFDNSKFEFIDGSIGTAEDVFPHFDLITKKELLKKAQDLYQAGLHDLGYALIKQSTHMDDNEQVPDPNVTFRKNPETGKEQLIGFSYADRNSNKFYIPIRKTIYNTSGFFNYFIRRNTLIAELFVEAIRMIVYHEFFHIANGHGLLSQADSSYTSQKDVSVCIEQNADDSAMRMMVCELLFDTLDGNPGSMQLKYSRKEIIHTWAIRIFAGYLALSWMHRGNDRKWDQKMIEEYIKNDGLTHPLYQFRTFNIINCALNRLQDIAKSSEMKLITADGILIDETLIGEVISTTNDLLNSFESSFCMTYDDNRSMEEKILQSWKAEKSSIPQIPQEVPFLMALLSDLAAAEAEKIRQIWPELNNRLKEVGAYNIRFSKI